MKGSQLNAMIAGVLSNKDTWFVRAVYMSYLALEKGVDLAHVLTMPRKEIYAKLPDLVTKVEGEQASQIEEAHGYGIGLGREGKEAKK